MIPSKYVVVDIETTGFSWQQDRIIEIAAILCENGNRIKCFHSLVNPGFPIPPDIVSLTGITQSDVICAPSLDEIKPTFLAFIGCLPIVGHNILTFDLPFLSAQLDVSIQNEIIDTLPLARETFSTLPRFKLEYLKRVLHLGSSGSHRALEDAETTNALLQACQFPHEYELLVQQAIMEHEEESSNPEHGGKKNRKQRFGPRIDYKAITPSCGCSEASGPLCGKVVVFTGELSIPRDEAMQMAVDAGAILKSSVTLKTNYLVVGVQDITLVGFDGMSTKEEKAHSLNAGGKANIQIIAEQEFLALLKQNEPCQATENTCQIAEDTCQDTATPEERNAYELIYPELKDILMDAPIDSGLLIFQELSNSSSVYFLDVNELFFRIRLRKKSRYILIPEQYEYLLPEGTQVSHTKSDEGMVRILISSYEDILKYTSVLRAVLEQICRRHRDFGCCSRYEACSDALGCIHPDPKFAIRCWYRQNLVEGKVFYGKNRT